MSKKTACDLLKISKKAIRAISIGELDEKGRIPVVFSTETPVKEFDKHGRPYLEVFVHSPETIDTSALRDGNRVTFLESHMEKPMVVLGSVTDITFDFTEKVGRGFIEFSDTQRGQDAKKDFLAGHREFVSLGAERIFPPISVTDDPSGSGLKVLRFKWRLKDISGVHEPADPNAGAFRSASEGNDDSIEIKLNSTRRKSDMTKEELDKKAAELKAKEDELALEEKAQREAKKKFEVEVGEDKAQRELKRRDTIDQMCKLAVEGLEIPFADVHKEAQRMKDEGLDPKDFRAWMVKAKAERQKSMSAQAKLGLTDKEQVKFSLAKALRAMHNGTFGKDSKEAGFEFEVSKEAEKLQPEGCGVTPGRTSHRSLTLPRDITHSLVRRTAMTPQDIAFYQTALRSMSVDQATKGGAWTAEGLTAARFIDVLLAATITDQINITKIPGLTTDLSFAVLDAIQTAYSRGEHEGTTLSDLTTSVRKMSPRLVSAGTKITQLLSIQASPLGIDAIIERKLALAQAIKKNQLFLYGTGINKEPLGIFNNTGVNVVAGGANGLAPTLDNYINMRTLVMAANAGSLPGQPSVFLFNSVTIGKNQRTPVEAGTNALRIMPYDRPLGETIPLLGHPSVESNLLRSNLTKGSGTDLSECAFLNPQEVYEGQWGTTRVIVDDKTAASTDETITYIHDYLDYMVGHASAISIMNDLITT